MNIPFYQMFVWTVIIAVKLLLLVILLYGGGRRYPAFILYVAGSTLGSISLYVLNMMAGPEAYFWAYWSKQAIDSGLMLWVIYEIFYDLFHPFWTIPSRTRDAAVFIFLPAAICVTASAMMSPSTLPDCFLRSARMYSRAVIFNSLLSVGAIAVMAKYFMIPWRERTRGIFAGITLPLLVQSVVAVSKSYIGTTEAQLLGTIGMLSDLTGIVAWIAAFSVRETEVGYGSAGTEVELHSEVLFLRSTVHSTLGIPLQKKQEAFFTRVQDGFIVDESSEQLTKGCDGPYGL